MLRKESSFDYREMMRSRQGLFLLENRGRVADNSRILGTAPARNQTRRAIGQTQRAEGVGSRARFGRTDRIRKPILVPVTGIHVLNRVLKPRWSQQIRGERGEIAERAGVRNLAQTVLFFSERQGSGRGGGWSRNPTILSVEGRRKERSGAGLGLVVHV